MRCTKIMFCAAVLTALCFTLIPLFSASSFAGKVYPGATEMGKLIRIVDKNNVDEIKDELPPSFYTLIKDWGMKVRTTENKKYTYSPPPGYQRGTEQNKKVVVIMDPHKGLLNYNDHGGEPFPGPKTLGTTKEENLRTGIEVQWNSEKAPKGDDFNYPYVGHFMSSRGDERSIGGAWDVIRWVGRTEVEPLGSFEPNPKGVEHKELMNQIYPFELKGTSICTFRYLDPNKADDMWVYVASLRRIRRMSTAQRCDTHMGSDFIYDDFRGTSWKIETADHEFLGTRDTWICINQVEDLTYNKGEPYPMRTNEILEKRPCYVNEIHHHDPNYIYGKRIV